MASLIPVDASKLLPLLPAAYSIVPAAALGVGAPTDGIVVLASFRGFDQTVDARTASEEYVAIWVAILVAEPAEAVDAGVDIPGALHGYALAAHVKSAQVFASLQIADMPVELLGNIGYLRGMDDASGVGDVLVTVPAKDAPFSSFHHSEGGYAPAGALDAVFWYDGRMGRAALHYHGETSRQGFAISQIYADPQSALGNLIGGGGWGPCAADPATGNDCVIAPAFSLRYDGGSVGRLLLVG